VDLTTDNILEAYDLPKFLDEWNVQQLLKPLLDCGASVQVCCSTFPSTPNQQSTAGTRAWPTLFER
jgi:hypothetical protein